MATTTTLVLGFGLMLILLAAVIFTVKRRERFAFVLGVALIIAALSLLPSEIGSGAVAVVGFVLLFAATVPLLRHQGAEV